jgi:hypothetical protein
MRHHQSTFFFALFIVASAVYFSFNVICLLMEPFNVVWRRPVVPREAWAIEQFRHAKISYLSDHPDEYNGLILGDSRATANQTTAFNRTTGNHYFNLAVSADSPVGFERKAEWIVRTQSRVRTVMVFLWYDQFFSQVQPDWLTRREHPAVSGESWLSYYWAFSNLPYNTFWPSFRYYLKRIAGLPTDTSTVANDGFDPEGGDVTIWGPSYSEFEPTAEDRRQFAELVEKDPPGRVRFQKQVLESSTVAAFRVSYSKPLLDLQIRSFRETLRVFRRGGINVECLVVPHPARLMARVPANAYVDWLRLISHECGAFWDFSLPSSITRDNFNFLDAIHFLPHVANMMITKVAGGELKDLEQHPDFGRWVTQDNFDEHVTEQREYLFAGR